MRKTPPSPPPSPLDRVTQREGLVPRETPPSPPAAALAGFAVRGVNPALAYEQTVAVGSRPAVRCVTRYLAGLLVGREHVTWEEACALPWWEVTRPYCDRLRAIMVEQKLAPRSVNQRLSILRSILTAAWNAEQMPTDAYMRAKAVKGVDDDHRKIGRALAQDEIGTLLSTAVTRFPGREGVMYAAIIAVMYAGGLRRAEIAALTRRDVRRERDGTVALDTLGKRNKRRIVYLPAGATSRLDAWLDLRGDAPGPLFLQKAKLGGRGVRYDERPFSPNGITAVITAIRAVAGVDYFTPHDFRRSYGTLHLDAGSDLPTVKEMMGHSSVATTASYDRRAERARKVAARNVDVDAIPPGRHGQ